MMNTRRNHFLTFAASVAALALAGAAAPCSAAVLFSYDSTAGQMPDDQGWSAFEIDATGPLTARNLLNGGSGLAADFANVAMEDVGGVQTLHMRDTLTDDEFNLPLYTYAWTAAQQQALLTYGLKFTMVYKGLTTSGNTAGGKGNVRFGFNNTEFETQAGNIAADQAIEVLGLSSEIASTDDGPFRTLVITGQMNAGNFELSYTVDGGASVPLNIISNPSLPAVESSVYFGGSSSGGRGTDLFVRSVVMETLAVPEPAAATLSLTAVAAMAAIRRRRR